MLAVLGGLALTRLAHGSPSRPTVILILIDTLRADRVGAYDHSRGLTPFLDELAAKGTVFLNAYSTTAWTSPAVASLFTSRWPSQHGIVNYDSKLGAAEVTLAERLKQAGYDTAGVVANGQISTERGFGQGFAFLWTGVLNQDIRAATIRKRTIWWLDVVKSSSPTDPKFLYLHYLEPHAPYEPPEPYRSKLAFKELSPADIAAAQRKFSKVQTWRDLQPSEVQLIESYYDGEVAALDAEIRLMFGELEKRGLLKNAVVVVTADHGEEFNEHGSFSHGLTLYDEMIRIPLIVVAPGRPGGRTVGESVSLADVAPTLLELAGVSAEPCFEGRSLVPLLGSEALENTHPAGWWAALWSRLRGTSTPPLPTDTILEIMPNGSPYDLRRHARAIISGSTKLVVSPTGASVYYDLERDPHELTPISSSLDDRGRRLAAALENVEAAHLSRAATTVEKVPLDKATRERLRALGYDADHVSN